MLKYDMVAMFAQHVIDSICNGDRSVDASGTADPDD
jgi:hypothetical protein